jgi:hypothetical protein
MRIRTLSVAPLVLGVCFASVGCDGDDPAPGRDAGPVDAARPDPTPPTVRSTTPPDGASLVARDAELVLRFSEPMDVEVGRVEVAPGGAVLTPADGEWDEAGSTLTLVPASRWPSGEVTVTVTSEFADPSGNPLAEPHVFGFTTVDDVRPQLVSSAPMEGATDLSARIDAIELTFDEPMNTTVGSIDVLGGAATVGPAEWSDDATSVSFPVADLEYERDYDVALNGFTDRVGNALDPVPVLEDGVLDFSTGVDADRPRVVRSEPAEGQLDVNADAVDDLLVTFDEPMDVSVARVRLSDGDGTVERTGEWTAGGRVLRVDVRGLLEFETTYRVDLTDLRDRAGNALDPMPYLEDGFLDFTVSTDAFAPFVRSSDPVEGAPEVAYRDTDTITLELSEAMDTSVAAATLSGGAAPVDLTGTWIDDLHVRFDVSGLLVAGTAYRLDVTALRDVLGNPLDTGHGYLDDGVLDFTTAPPAGEGCRDPLTVAEATETAGVYEWTFAAGAVTERDGGTAACDPNGGATNGPDGLIRYDKVAPEASASGGKHLRIVVEAESTSADFDVAIATGASCDPSAAPVRCHADAIYHDIVADVPAGPVWIWVSRTVDSTSRGVRVRVQEVDPPRTEGESCEAPFTTSSPNYSAPASADGPHVWLISEHDAVNPTGPSTMDIGPRSVTDGSLISCDPDGGHHADAVVRYEKASDDSVLEVTLNPESSSSYPPLNLEVFSACDVASGAPERHGCLSSVGPAGRSVVVDAPAGPLHLWLTADAGPTGSSGSDLRVFPRTILAVRELTGITDGELCSRALPLSAGSNAVAGSSDERFEAPSCFGETSDVEWYRITASEPVLVVSGDAAGGVALFDPAAARELDCSADAASRPAARFVPVGTEVCVAVEMGTSLATLDVIESPYGGLGASPPVDLGILPPLNGSGAVETITGDDWMAVGAGTLFLQYGSSEGLDATLGGGERGVYRSSADGLTSGRVGNTGVFAAGQLFSFDDTTSATSNRVHRLWDGTSPFWTPTVWDASPSYPTEEVSAAAVRGDTIFFVTGDDQPHFYALDAGAPSAPALLGTNDTIRDAVGLAVDDTHVYVVAERNDASAVEGVYRIARSDLGDPMAPALNLTPRIDLNVTGFPRRAVPVVVDAPTLPAHLYVRNARGHVEVVRDPGGASPLHLGEVITVGGSGDHAMAFDEATGSLYLFETDSDADGRFLRYDP